MKSFEGMNPKRKEQWQDWLDEHLWDLMTREYPTTAEFLENLSDSAYETVAEDMKALFLDVLLECDMILGDEE